MTVKNIIEQVQTVFPKIGKTQIIKSIDYAQKKYAGEIGLLRKTGTLSSPSSNITWTLPTDCKQVIDILFYNSNDMPLYMDDLGLSYEIVFGKITFINDDGTKLSNLPTTVDSAYIVYEHYPSTVDGEDDSLDIDEELHDAIVAWVMKDYHSKYPVEVMTNDGVIMTKDWRAVSHWQGEYMYYLKTGRMRAEADQDGVDSQPKMNSLGYPIITRRQKITSGSSVSVTPLSETFSKYIRFTAVSPSTVSIDEQFGWDSTIPTPSVSSGTIEVTGSAVFSASTFVNPNQNINYTYQSSSQIDLYPTSNWGTLVVEIYER